jgi:hypothetical protein
MPAMISLFVAGLALFAMLQLLSKVEGQEHAMGPILRGRSLGRQQK